MNTHHITIRIGCAALAAAMLVAPSLGDASAHRSGPGRLVCDVHPTESDCGPGRRVTAIDLAQRFVAARDTWDGETVRSLVADDAAIDDFAVAAVDDYLANAEFERITGWRFMQSECSTTSVGPPTVVTCSYTMENALSRALGAGPFVGSSFEFIIADGQIQQVVNEFDFSLYSPQVFEVFLKWLLDAYPGHVDVMFAGPYEFVRSTTPAALALWEQHVPEFVSSARTADSRDHTSPAPAAVSAVS